MKSKPILALAACAALGLWAGCEDDDDSAGIEIAGSYSDGFSSHDITETTWTISSNADTSDFLISNYSNTDDYLVAQNDSDNAYSPSKWSRFDWSYKGSDLYYCQVVFDAAAKADAEEAESANRSDLDAGCNGYPWSKLTVEK